MVPLHSSLGDKVELHIQKEKRNLAPCVKTVCVKPLCGAEPEVRAAVTYQERTCVRLVPCGNSGLGCQALQGVWHSRLCL